MLGSHPKGVKVNNLGSIRRSAKDRPSTIVNNVIVITHTVCKQIFIENVFLSVIHSANQRTHIDSLPGSGHGIYNIENVLVSSGGHNKRHKVG